jgi:hypothetical protein
MKSASSKSRKKAASRERKAQAEKIRRESRRRLQPETTTQPETKAQIAKTVTGQIAKTVGNHVEDDKSKRSRASNENQELARKNKNKTPVMKSTESSTKSTPKAQRKPMEEAKSDESTPPTSEIDTGRSIQQKDTNKTKRLPRNENQKLQVERDKSRERKESKVNEQVRNETRESG